MNGNIIQFEVSEMNLIIDMFNDLITTNRGMIAVYDTAVNHLNNEAHRTMLQSFKAKHETFVTELSNLVVGYGGTPVENSSNLVAQATVRLKALFSSGDGPILAAVTEDAEEALNTYGDAISEDMFDDGRDLIRKHMSQIHTMHEKLSALSAIFNN